MTRKAGRRWTRLAHWTIQRDQGICWICGHPGADTADHLESVDAAPQREFDPTNLAAAHGAARPEYNCPGQYARGNYPGAIRPTWTPRTLTVVLGPPCGGKTTYIDQHRDPADIVIDHDALAQALGAPAPHPNAGPHPHAAKLARQAVIDAALDDNLNARVWIIHTAPTPQQLTRYTDHQATPIMCDPGQPTALRRATHRPTWTTGAIRNWYTNEHDRLHQWAATTPTPTTPGQPRSRFH